MDETTGESAAGTTPEETTVAGPAAAKPVKKKRPVAGFLFGIVFGLGLALSAVNFKVIELSVVPMLIVLVLGIVLGVLWSMFGPAKKPKGMAPTG